LILEIESVYFLKQQNIPISHEHQTYIQCTEMYHCTPSELLNQDEALLEYHWLIRNQIAIIHKREQDTASGIDTINLSNEYEFNNLDESEL